MHFRYGARVTVAVAIVARRADGSKKEEEARMFCTACTVIPTADSHGPYLSNGMALRVATAEALALHRQGRRSKICVQNRDGDTQVEYCLCDAFKRIRP